MLSRLFGGANDLTPVQTLWLVLLTAAVVALFASFIIAAVVNLLAAVEAAVGRPPSLKP